MKKPKSEKNDWPRAEYKREDLGPLVRGKFYKKAAKSACIVLLEPEVAKVFPTSAAVNKALLDLIMLAKQSTRITNRSTQIRTKTARAS
jgi:hypothetical protein